MKIRLRLTAHTLYLWSLFIKAFDGIFEIIVGSVLFFVRPDQIHGLVRLLTQFELSEDKHDLISNYLMHASENLSFGTQLFGAWYLLGHGIIKIFLVVSLLKKKYWAYPVAAVFFSLFIIYQIYRYTLTRSPFLVVLTIFDLAVIWLILIEYRRIKKQVP